MSLLDTVYDMNRERIRKGKRVITLDQETGTIFYPPNPKRKETKNESDKHHRRSPKRA